MMHCKLETGIKLPLVSGLFEVLEQLQSARLRTRCTGHFHQKSQPSYLICIAAALDAYRVQSCCASRGDACELLIGEPPTLFPRRTTSATSFTSFRTGAWRLVNASSFRARRATSSAGLVCWRPDLAGHQMTPFRRVDRGNQAIRS